MMKKRFYLLVFTMLCTLLCYGDNLATGEYAVLGDGSPAMIGQPTRDHLFVRGDYNDTGYMRTYDNVVSFKSGAVQTVWFWLDDDQIYTNESVQALTPIALNSGETEFYNEVTYNSFQCDIYVPQQISLISSEDEEGEEILFERGDRMPSTSNISWHEKDGKTIDGVEYRVYSIVCSSNNGFGCHLSSKNAKAYRDFYAENQRPRMKDDAAVFGLFMQNKNQAIQQGQFADIIIANVEFGLREPVRDGWEPNDYRFIYGTGGNNETQRFQLYNRVALYGSNGIANILATSISLDRNSANLNVGEALQLDATVLPVNTTNKTVTWSTSNSSVATVDNNGVVTAKSAGSATITAKTSDGTNLRASCNLTVTQRILATSISLNNSNAGMIEGENMQLTATVLPSNTTNKTVTWSTSNSSVATVDNNGVVTAKSPGTAIIIAATTDGSNLAATCVVTVTQRILATSITLNKKSAMLTAGETLKLFATVQPINATNRAVTWSTGNSSIATVNSNGLVTAISPGTVLITATTADGTYLRANCTLTVKEPDVMASSITLDQSNTRLTEGETLQLTATVLPENTTNKSVTWATSNSNVATVSNSGLVTAVAPGIATITATTADGTNLSATCSLTIYPQVVLANSITLNQSNAEVTEGETLQLTANVLPANATNKTVTWTTSNSTIATVDDNGLVTTKKPGTVTITATTTDGSNLSANCVITVNKQIILARYIALNKASAELTVGETLQLTATILPSNTTDKTITWSTSNATVATVDGNGLVTTIGPGSATITATTADGSNLSANCQLTVKLMAQSISLNESSAEMAKGTTLQLTATVLPDNASNKAVTWTSSDPTIASVDDNGLVTAIAHGTATITAMTEDGSDLTASCVVTVLADLSDYDNYLSLNDTSVFCGETIIIPVKMTNAESIVSFQTDIFLPEGLEIVQEDGDYLIDPSDRMTRTHSIMCDDVANGAIRVLCYSSNYKPFTGNSDDDLFYITVKVADDAQGDYTISLKNTLLTNSDFEEIAAPDVAANVHVKAYLLGDANASGTVTVTDVVVTSMYVLEKDPQPFVFTAADVNGDNNITVTDVSRIAWMVLNPTQNAPRRAPVLWNNGDRMSGEAITIAAGETRRVSIMLDNEMDYAAFQLDLNLPDGLTASNIQLSGRASSHAFDVNTLQSGDIRALCYSPAMAAINGHEGTLLTFDVAATSSVSGDITVDGIELVTTDCQTVKLDAFTIGVNTATSMSELNSTKAVARIDYFDVAGRQLDQPTSGINIVVTTYTDGTHSTTKIYK